MKTNIKVSGRIRVTNALGVIVAQENLVVDSGLDWIASRLSGAGTNATHIGIGTGAVAADAGDTSLGGQLLRKAVTVSGGTVVDNTVTFATTFAAGEATGALTEVGLFTAASAGTMIARSVFNVYNKAAGDLLNVEWTFTVA